MNPSFTNALIGGIIIGFATVLMMHFNGRVTGISGIINGLFKYVSKDWAWRFLFVIGLFVGGLWMKSIYPQGFTFNESLSPSRIIAAGLLVGFGTILGSGCTSGHGVCGISRLSKRSIIATLTFIGSGVLTLVVKKYLLNFF